MHEGDMQKMAPETFTYRDKPVYYYKTGEGPPLLVLHGWGSRASVMLPLAQELSGIRTCYIPDLPGFGDSPPPDRAWSVDDYADFTEAFSAEVIGKEQPVDLLAHSFGGRVTLKWCRRNDGRDRVRQVVITGGAGMKPRRTFSYYRRRFIAMALKAPFQLLPGSLKCKATEWLRSTKIWKSLGSSEYQQLDGVMRETFVKTVSEHLESCLPEIQHEVLLLWGKEDPATPWYQAERMERGLKNGALVGIDGAGHYAFLDQPDRFVRIVRAFYQDAG